MSGNHTEDRKPPDEGVPVRAGGGKAVRTDSQIVTDGGEDSPLEAGDRELPERSIAARIGPDGTGTISAGGFEYRFSGGEWFDTADAPTPVDHFLGGLASCLLSSITVQANIRNVEVSEISVTADATPAEGSVEAISLSVRVDADAETDVIERMVINGERTCHVSELLREDLSVDLEWEDV